MNLGRRRTPRIREQRYVDKIAKLQRMLVAVQLIASELSCEMMAAAEARADAEQRPMLAIDVPVDARRVAAGWYLSVGEYPPKVARTRVGSRNGYDETLARQRWRLLVAAALAAGGCRPEAPLRDALVWIRFSVPGKPIDPANLDDGLLLNALVGEGILHDDGVGIGVYREVIPHAEQPGTEVLIADRARWALDWSAMTRDEQASI